MQFIPSISHLYIKWNYEGDWTNSVTYSERILITGYLGKGCDWVAVLALSILCLVVGVLRTGITLSVISHPALRGVASCSLLVSKGHAQCGQACSKQYRLWKSNLTTCDAKYKPRIYNRGYVYHRGYVTPHNWVREILAYFIYFQPQIERT
jgi:hypothetical protein